MKQQLKTGKRFEIFKWVKTQTDDVMQSCRRLPTFRELKMDAIFSFETLLTHYSVRLVWHHLPDDHNSKESPQI
jgi:hypothetical protein